MNVDRTFYPAGNYWGQVISQALGVTSTGKPQLVIGFEIVGKIDPADPGGDLLAVEAPYGRQVYRVITEDTIDWVMRDLETLGFTGDRFEQFDSENPDSVRICGMEAGFRCEHSVYEGVVRENWLIDSGPRVAAKLDKDDAAKLNAMFGRQLKEQAKRISAEQGLPGEKISGPDPEVPTAAEIIPKPGSRPAPPHSPGAVRPNKRRAAPAAPRETETAPGPSGGTGDIPF